MRRFVIWMSLVSLAVVTFSCKSSDVASHSLVQKRKYRKGWHVNFSKDHKRNIAVLRKGQVGVQQNMQTYDGVELVKLSPKDSSARLEKAVSVTRKAEKKKGFLGAMIATDDQSAVAPLAAVPPVEDYFGEEKQANNKADDMALASFILGLLTWLLPILGFVCCILAIIFGFKGLSSEKNHWMAVTGLVLGGVFLALVLFLLMLIVLVI